MLSGREFTIDDYTAYMERMSPKQSLKQPRSSKEMLRLQLRSLNKFISWF